MGCTRMTEAKSGSADLLKQDKIWKKFPTLWLWHLRLGNDLRIRAGQLTSELWLPSTPTGISCLTPAIALCQDEGYHNL